MTFRFTSETLQKFPHHKFGFGIVRNTVVVDSNEDTKRILTDVYQKIRRKYTDLNLSSLLISVSYITAQEKIGGKRFGYPYDQIQRVLDGSEIHNINNFVNTYMKYELLTNLSFSSYDLDGIEEEVLVSLAQEKESIILLGGKEVAIPKGDLVFRDKKSIFYSFTKGYADRTKLTKNTKNVLYTIDAPEGIDKRLVEENMKDLCHEFGSTEYFILDKDNYKKEP